MTIDYKTIIAFSVIGFGTGFLICHWFNLRIIKLYESLGISFRKALAAKDELCKTNDLLIESQVKLITAQQRYITAQKLKEFVGAFDD